MVINEQPMIKVGEAHSSHLATSSQSEVVPDPRLRILVAEDDHDLRQLVSIYLKGSPHTLEFADNGLLAVEQWERKPFDLVFMDIQMPVMDGLTATTRIRAEERARQLKPTPIIALSANAEAQDRARSRDAGCTTHLSKPLSKQNFLTAVHEHGRLSQ